MKKSFEEFWNGFNNPTTPLACKVVYIRDTPLEKADVEMLEEFCIRWKEDNTDPTGAEECTLEEIELYIECAKEVQEEEEIEEIKVLNFEEYKRRIKFYLE